MKVGIFHTAFLGDLALAGMLIEALFRCGHEIFLFTNNGGASLYLNDPRILETVVVTKGKGFNKVASMTRIAREIRIRDVDALLLPHQSATTALIAWMSKVPKRVGFSSAPLSLLYTQKTPRIVDRHESFRCLDLAPEWLVTHAVKTSLETDLARPVLAGGDVSLTRFLAAFPDFFAGSKPFFILAPGSVWATKRYPAEGYAKAAKLLLDKNSDLRCVLSGGPSDAAEIHAFLNALAHPRVFDASMCLPLPELVALTRRAAFVISNDSSPLHIASGVNTPVVAVFGPTPWTTGFAPSSERHAIVVYAKEDGSRLECQPCSAHGGLRCPVGHHLCLRALDAKVIADAAIRLVPEIFV